MSGVPDPHRPKVSTITDVAREAGVSVATVSRALRGLDRVSPLTRQRVQRIASELSYVASPTATSLASGRTRVVGVVTPYLNRWFFATVLSGVERELRAHGHHALLIDLEGERAGTRLHLDRSMLWKRADAALVLNIPLDQSERAVLDELRLPMVSIGVRLPGRPSVGIDDAEAVRCAADHLIDLGHTRIAYLGDVRAQGDLVATPRTRRETFVSHLAERGLDVPSHWLLDTQWDAESAARDTLDLLAGSDRPTAVLAACDEMAFGVCASARRLGLDVPRDVSVTGIDDHSLAGVLGLTTVRQDVVDQGRRAARLLLAELLGGVTATEQPTCAPVRLIVRETTGPSPT